MPNPQETLPDLESSARWSIRGYQAYDLRFGRLERDTRGPAIYLDLGYADFPQEDFFGLGPDSEMRDRTDFRLEQESYDIVGAYRFNSWLNTSLRAGYMQVNTGPGTDDRYPDIGQLFGGSDVPGLAAQPDFLRVHYQVAADYRDVPGNPHGGGLLAAGFGRYDDRGGGAFSFNRVEFDARHYIPVGSTVRILALRFFTSFDNADSEAEVPYYFQRTLGGGDALRGFREFRFRDRNLLYMSGEYRWEPVRAVELAVFYDAGKVFSRRADFDFSGLKKSVGFGVRFKAPGSVVFRIDTARSSEGTRVFFKFGPSF
jgi:outer membrane protein assembly factor BamA